MLRELEDRGDRVVAANRLKSVDAIHGVDGKSCTQRSEERRFMADIAVRTLPFALQGDRLPRTPMHQAPPARSWTHRWTR